MVIIAHPESAKQARRILDEIAAEGGYQAAGVDDRGFQVYHRKTHDNQIEELRVEMKGPKNFDLVKEVVNAEKID